jgi:DNA/RNA endonuclease YhcR with UshA esterase domain
MSITRLARSTTMAGVVLLGMTTPMSAHHSWGVQYDGSKPVTVKGVVSKVEWTNPHTHFYVDVVDDKGTTTTWNFEMASTLALERGGFTRKTLPVGTTVTITGFGGREVTSRAIANSIVTAEGKSLFVAERGQ